MKKYNIHDIAKILQIDEAVRIDLKNNFESYNEEAKYNIIEDLWDGLYELHEKLTQVKYQLLLAEVGEGKRKLTSDLQIEAKRAVWKDIDDMLTGKAQELSEIDQIRNKLKFLTEDVQKTEIHPVKSS